MSASPASKSSDPDAGAGGLDGATDRSVVTCPEQKDAAAAATAVSPESKVSLVVSREPPICIDIIAQVAKFASTKNVPSGYRRNVSSDPHTHSDLQNICVAVRHKQHVKAIRRTFLHKNYGYLSRSLEIYFKSNNAERYFPTAEKCRNNIKEWMKINTDWPKLVTNTQIDFWQEKDEGSDNVDAFWIYGTHPPEHLEEVNRRLKHLHFAIFNNVRLAVYLDLVDVFRYYVKERGIDVNGHYKCTLLYGKEHLLVTCIPTGDIFPRDCFDYLLTLDSTDVQAKAYTLGYLTLKSTTEAPNDVSIQAVWCREGAYSVFYKQLISHRSFDPNKIIREQWMEGRVSLTCPLNHLLGHFQYAGEERGEEEEYKSKIFALLERGADPNLAVEGMQSPIETLEIMLEEEKWEQEKKDEEERWDAKTISLQGVLKAFEDKLD